MKKKLSVVLAVVLTVILLLTCVTSAAYGWNLGTKVEKLLPMEYYDGAEPMNCGPESGVSIGQYYREKIDRDEDGTVSEDFEWGSDGTSLEDWQVYGGEVEWTLTKIGGWWFGNPVAEIETEPDHVHSGIRSARFYRGMAYGSYMQASYPQDSPTYRKFYFYFEQGSSAKLYTTTGDGEHRILVRVSLDGEDYLVEYHDGNTWNAQPIDYSYWVGGWHCLEFRNIDWVHATYDVYYVTMADEPVPVPIPVFEGAHMKEDLEYNGMTAYYNAGGIGSECWIDDILDTGGDYPNLPSEDYMYSRLLDCMEWNEEFGIKRQNYGPGFVAMTQEYGYYNFDDDYDYSVTDDDWDYIKDAIDSGWPVALRGGFGDVGAQSKDGDGPWPPQTGHYIAIRGYGYYELTVAGWTVTYGHYIICTDSRSKSNELVISWDNLIDNGDGLVAITIRDN